MYGEDGQPLDLDELREAIAQSDVLIVGFRAFPERLLVDSRTNGPTGPMVRVVEPVSGVEERLRWLTRRRPQFGLPQRFTFFVWPRSVGYLEETGVAQLLREHVGHDGVPQISAALGELHALERSARRAAVSGGPWQTLWQAQGTSSNR